MSDIDMIVYSDISMELYHALNRGVEKRALFLDTQDYMRFVHDMRLFNDTKRAENVSYILSHPHIDVRHRYEGERLVDIHGWCLMKNHYHLLLSERIDGGISKFLQKLNGGYAKYFNERYGRVGTLYQGKSKKILIDSDAHFLHILHYIHLNPLDYIKSAATWRERKITKVKAAVEYLSQYRWSSYREYCGANDAYPIVSTELFNDVFKDYQKSLTSYLADLEIETPASFLLE